MANFRSAFGSTLIGFSIPKTNGSVAAGRLVRGVSVLARMSGDTPNSFGCDSSLKFEEAVTTAAPPEAGKSPNDPR